MRTPSSFAPARAPARLCLVAVALALLPASGTAQETDTTRLANPDTLTPVPADSFILVDTILEPGDTVTVEADLADTLAADTTTPPPRLVPLPLRRPLEPGFAEGVWEWDRGALLRSTALNLADLIERVPGLTRVRSGYYGQPELVVATYALTGDVEVLLDGFPYDPLTGTTVDLASIGITDLERVRVERRGGRLRVELTQLEHPAPRGGFETSPDTGATYTRVEIATGDLDTDGLAGVFMAPRFLIGPFAAALSRLNSEGIGRAQEGQISSTWLRWSHLRPRWGVHAEYRRGGVDRAEGSVLAGEATRQDVVVRARARPWDPLTAEIYAAESEVDDRFIDSMTTELTTRHFGVRAAFDAWWLSTSAALRVRSGDGGPTLATELAGDLRPLGFLALSGEARHEDWAGRPLGALSAGVRLGPWLGARLFGEWSDGKHGVAWLENRLGPAEVERRHLRAGLDWTLGGWRLGAAAFTAEADSVAPPVLPGIGPFGSRTSALYPGFDIEGFEVTGRIPLYISSVGLEGSYTRVRAIGEETLTLFQPVEQARAAIVWHDLPLETAQFEVDIRLEGEYRGEMLAPGAQDDALVVVAPTQRVNFDMTLRVLDVHAYVSWQNILHDVELADLPGRVLPGQTAYFGVKWELWN